MLEALEEMLPTFIQQYSINGFLVQLTDLLAEVIDRKFLLSYSVTHVENDTQ